MTNLALNNELTSSQAWVTLCQEDDLISGAGVCALLDSNEQIALFKVDEKTLYCVSNFCPFGQANVLYRGILGDTKTSQIYVASPLYKQRFLLETGECLEDKDAKIKTFPVRIENKLVQIQLSTKVL